MIMAVVTHDEAQNVLDALVGAGHAATFTESRGGMLRQRQLALFIAAEQEDVAEILSLIQEHCHRKSPAASGTVTAELGGAAVFVWDLERFETY
ncbi:MAG: cyclic-di-AMP receptor [Anaerolineae bacterium]